MEADEPPFYCLCPSDSHSDSLGDGRRLTDFERGSLRDIGVELRAELVYVIGEKRGLMAGAGDGDVAKAGVEQVRVDAGVGVYKDALCGKSLGAVAGNGVAMVEMAVVQSVEFNLAIVV